MGIIGLSWLIILFIECWPKVGGQSFDFNISKKQMNHNLLNGKYLTVSGLDVRIIF